MRLFTSFIALLVMLGIVAAGAQAEPVNPNWKQKWNYIRAGLTNDAEADHLIDLLKQSKDAGCTHIALQAGGMGKVDQLKDPEYIKRAEKVRAAAKEMNLAIVPMIFSLGYGGATLGNDPNLMAGLPVKDMPFTVKGNVAEPDATAGMPTIANGDFEQFEGNKFTGWEGQTAPGEGTFVDTEVKHSGKASLRIVDADKAKAKGKAPGSAIQTIKVKPFQYYRLSCWLKTENYAVNGGLLTVTSNDNKRTNTAWNLALSKAQKASKDWVHFEVLLNTLDATEVKLYVGGQWARGGTIWIDDVALEPAGLLLAIHRDTAPLVVTSEDGKTTYAEGKDYKPVIDPAVTAFAKEGELEMTHPAPKLELAEGSSIKDGQKVLISFFHCYQIDSDQHVVTMQDPRVLQIWEQLMDELVKVWPAPGYFMSGYDEIRMGGWEPQPNGEKLTPGELLAKHTNAAYQIIKKRAPEATVYTWSDMYTPLHNGRPGIYWLANGSYENSWKDIPRDIVMMNWYAPKADAVQFFADLGHHQVLCGYYDERTSAGVQKNLRQWEEVSAGVKNVDGMMYTTWGDRYKFMNEFFKLVDAYPTWPSPAAPAPAK